MNCIMNENFIVTEYDSKELLIPKIDSIIDNSIRECQNN